MLNHSQTFELLHLSRQSIWNQMLRNNGSGIVIFLFKTCVLYYNITILLFKRSVSISEMSKLRLYGKNPLIFSFMMMYVILSKEFFMQ